jgi:hypothetical protein
VSTSSGFAYVQARLQARHGQRPEEERWHLLESSTDLGSYLQQARATALAPWVQHLPSHADTHEIEQSVRRNWRHYTDEIAKWVPEPWGDAIRWTGTLPDLPFVAHLALGGSIRPWMLQDPVLAPLALVDSQRREESLEASPFAGVAVAIRDKQPPVEAWLDAWESRLPAAGDIEGLASLKRLLARHMENILQEPAARPEGPALRAQLAERLTSLFRRESGRIGAVFAHIGLLMLDVERLRGGLVLRALFPDPLERPRWA